MRLLFPLAAVVCLLAGLPARAAPPESHPSPDESAATPASPEPSPATTALEDALAIRRARADLDAMVSRLLEEHSARALTLEPAPDLQREVLPEVLTSDAPPEAIDEPEKGPEHAWLEQLALPDIPIRFHERLVDLLLYYRDDPRGRAHIRAWIQRSGRYEAMIRPKLRELGLPEDLMYVAMVESGYDPNVVSHAGAVGMWQLVAPTAEDYSIEMNRWVDQRKSPELATEAAGRYLKDLRDKLGSWPLSLAAFNMGYGALLRSIRKYNTNDFWLLARLEAGLPYETIVYVAKIMACAIVAHNLEHFGLADLRRDPPQAVEYVTVPGGIGLGRLASAAQISVEAMAALNPELLKKRIPPDVKQWTLRIPAGKKDRFAKRWPEEKPETPTHATHYLRFGERIKDVAEMFGTTERKLRALNDLSDDEPVLPGARLRVPDVDPKASPAPTEPLVVGIPPQQFEYEGRRQVFYRVQVGDQPERIAEFFQVTLDELRSWNDVTTDASLHTGMVLQLFVPKSLDLSRALYLEPSDVRTLVVGSQEFFDHHEALRDRVRLRYRVKKGDTLASLAERFDLSVGSIARINGFNREREPSPDTDIILYVPTKDAQKLEANAARLAQD
jgi:membrane-bound lytic murein transglycosylase D